jgi:transcriptional regulator with XRE-family HTH domain
MKEKYLLTSVGKKIKMIREQKEMTQHGLAVLCGFEKASMSRIESGQANPTIRTLYKISKALGVHISHLFKK